MKGYCPRCRGKQEMKVSSYEKLRRGAWMKGNCAKCGCTMFKQVVDD